MSTLIPTASGAPASRSPATASSRASAPLAITATLAPSSANVVAIARPIPLLPPVTTAVDPARPRSIESPSFELRYAESAYAEPDDLFPNGTLLAVTGRPLAFDTRPDRAMDGQRVCL